jgi:DNA-directed RNA polymerase II subunit RPB2
MEDWDVIGSYFKEGHLERLVRHQIESYNHFINQQLQATIEMFNPVTVHSDHFYNKELGKYSLEIMITFVHFHINRPQIHENNGATKIMFPQEARLRNFTYAANTTIDLNIQYIVRTGPELEFTQCFHNVLKQIHIGKIPVMLKSSICILSQYTHIDHNTTGECKYDPGGYFIINGSEKTVLGQERAAENKIYCFQSTGNSNKYLYQAEMKSVPDYKKISPKQINMYLSKTPTGDYQIYVSIPRIRKHIPLSVLFRALGIITDKDICSKILLDLSQTKQIEMMNMLKGSIIDTHKCYTQEEAIQYITSHAMYTPMNVDKAVGFMKKREFTLEVLKQDLFPHCKTEIQKIYFTGHMACKLMKCGLKWIPIDDRDAYANKRVDLTGTLLNNLYRNYFNKLVKDMQKQIVREMNTGSWKSTDDYMNIINSTNIYKIIKSTTIENGIKRALSTGDFGIKQVNSNKVGVAQVLSRLTYASSLSHLRRINTPIDKSGKLIAPRKLHNTTWGFLCPAESPEGQSVGVVKNMSYMTHVTIHANSEALYEYSLPYIIPHEDMTPLQMYEGTKIFINGCWIGNTYRAVEYYHDMKDKKHRSLINMYTSIVFHYHHNEIYVCNDAGRMVRPVYRVKDQKVLLEPFIQGLKTEKVAWDNLLITAEHDCPIEYLDPAEQNNSMIAMYRKDIPQLPYTHCEIHPSTIFGVLASCIPFPEHNQSPRNTYQCAMGKQAMGIYVTNFHTRMDKTSYVLTYPTRPLVDTRVMNFLKLNEIPSGSNVTVAIMTHTGYNQEDSVMINQGAIDRGLFQITIYHTERDEDKKIHGDDEIRCKPDRTKTKGTKFGNYDKLDSMGLMPENTLIHTMDIIMGKVIPIKEARNDPSKPIKYDDHSKCYRTDEECYIDKNYTDVNGDGYSFWKCRIRALRQPAIGDKFSSRHGQKGTCGNIIPEKDMPFTANGIKPDIIINPHAIPSRMTIAQLKETLLGKILVELGMFGDGTAFMDLSVETLSKELIKLGYEGNGNELMYDGMTGQQLESSIFIGPVFYQRLKHMVLDKQHSRSIGPMVNLTRQPAEGRARDGGLRFGEMERDCWSEYTPIALTHGLSIMIKNLKDNIGNENIMGWSEEKNGMVPSRQVGFMDKGMRDCVELTYEDGRKNICTEDHPILTSENEWIKVKDVELGVTKIKTSITCPVVDIQEEMNECAGWTLEFDKTLLQTNTRDEFMKTLAFARMIGYLITDGHIDYKLNVASLYLGHMLDVISIMKDLQLFCVIPQTNFVTRNIYTIRIPATFTKQLIQLPGLLRGKKVNQPACLPAFLFEKCPRPIIREFLAGMFGGDGHTCVLGMHRGKRDILSSVSFSQTKHFEHQDTLQIMFGDIQRLLATCGIHHTTIQKPKETTSSKKKYSEDKSERSFQLTLHLPMEELIPFSEKIGFRYCCHKSQRLEAGVSYRRLREEVTRQHNWLVNRVDELTHFKKIKTENPSKVVPTKGAIEKAVQELTAKEGLLHEYAIPTTHDMTDHLMKGTSFGKFTSKSFPTAEQFLVSIGAIEWFNNTEEVCDISNYGVGRVCEALPTMNLRVISIIPVGPKHVYDISVEDTHSFLANGIVSHNCMISHGASSFTKERMYDASDKYYIHVCSKCGLSATFNPKVSIYHCRNCDNRTDFKRINLPYSCKLMFQELMTMNIVPRIIA